ncbi:MAG: OmpH family outer membrane protein [Saprospiraceae bacterium]
MKKTFVLTLGLLLSGTLLVSAQKFGYTNSAALLTQLPEVKQADSDLKAFQTQLTKKGQEMVKELQEKAESLQRKQDQGTISPKDYETQAATLQAEQDSIGKYEQEVYAKLAEKREELFKPILDRVNQAMVDVAKENGYQLVFDTSTQILLYADETLDVTALVKAKLGIK